ncbi:MAG: hypothetical protein RR338_02800, partial [Clostridia bacterium]
AYVPNFIQLIMSIVENANKPKPADAQAAASEELKLDEEQAARDAVLALIYSDEAFKITITRSLVAMMLAMFVPELGSIEEIFNKFDISLGVGLGDVVCKKIVPDPTSTEPDILTTLAEGKTRYSVDMTVANAPKLDATNGKYIKKTVNEKTADGKDNFKDYYIYNTDAAVTEKYTVTFNEDAKGEYIGTRKLLLGDKTARELILPLEERYAHTDKDLYEVNPKGNFACVTIDGKKTYFNLKNNAIFIKETDGTHTKVTNWEGTTPEKYSIFSGGAYYPVDSFNFKHNGYYLNEGGTYYRTMSMNNTMDEFNLGLNIEIGCVELGLELGGLYIGLGDPKETLLPEYIKNQTGHNGQGTVPLAPFYDTKISLSGSVELELAINEGSIDFGTILSGILGNIGGVKFDVPSTPRGYSSAHFRLDLMATVDMFDFAKSEASIKLVCISESGIENIWLAVYLMDGIVYIDGSYFDIPKLSIASFPIKEWLGGLIGGIVDEDIYFGGDALSGGDAMAASAKVSATAEDELAGAILIDYRKLTISIGNILFRYVLDLIKIDGLDIKSLIYKDIEANVDVTLDLKNTINLYIDVALALDGDRYKEVARDNVVVDGVDDVTTATENEALYEYYIFEKDAADAKVKGTYAINEKGEYYALAKMANYTGDRYTKMLVVREDPNKTPANLTDDKFYKVPDYNTDVKLSGFVADAKGIYGYGDKAGLHKLTVDEIKEIGEDITKRFSIDTSKRVEITDPTTVIYKYVAGSDVNFNECDTALTLNLGIKDLDLGFTTRQTNVLSASELAEYKEVGAMDRLSLSETIDLSTSFKQGKDIDLKELLIFLFPDVPPENLVALIQAESDKGGDVDRVLELVITVEIKFAALLNMFKRYTYTGADDMFTKDITFVDIITLIKGALIDGKVPILELLDYVNASVELWTKTNRDMTTGVYLDRHKMLGIYLLCGTYSTLTADEMKDDNAIFVPEKDRYDHYFEIASGAYGVKLDANGNPTYSKIPTVGDTKDY